MLIANQRFRDFEMPANSDTTFWTDIGYTARRPFRTPQDYQNWMAQMQDIPRYFREQMEEMRAGLKRGFTPPRVTMEGRDASITAVTEAAARRTVSSIPRSRTCTGVPAAEQAELRAAGAQDHPRCGAAGVRGVAEVHAHRIRAGLPHDARRRGPAGRQELLPRQDPRIHDARHGPGRRSTSSARPKSRACTSEMLAVMQETGFKGDFPAFQKFLRTDPQFYAKTPDELLMRAAWIAKNFDGKAAQFFGYLPRARFAINRCRMTWRRSIPRAAAGPASTCSTPTTCRAGRSTT